jgi:tetratricopeptide (TPR) repeat protein
MSPNSVSSAASAKSELLTDALHENSSIGMEMKEKDKKGVYLPTYATQLAHNGNYEAAVQWFSFFLFLSPTEDYRVYFNRAYCYLELNQPERALKDVERIIELEPDWSRAYYKRAEILSEMGRYEEAENEYKKSEILDKLDSTETQMAIKWNIYNALKSEGYDDVVAGYGRDQYSSIDEAKEGIESGQFDISLMMLRFAKQQKFLARKDKRLIPRNFY